MTALPNKHRSGHCRATEVESDKRTRGKNMEKNGHSRFQVQLWEDGGDNSLQDRAG